MEITTCVKKERENIHIFVCMCIRYLWKDKYTANTGFLWGEEMWLVITVVGTLHYIPLPLPAGF